MKVLKFSQKGTPNYSAADGFEALWERAEQIGRVSVETSIFNGFYQAEIAFKSRGGSGIYAKGTDKDKCTALEKAISEALSLASHSQEGEQG